MALVERVRQSCKKIGNECKKIKSMLFNWQLQMLYNNDCWCLLWDQHINIAQIKKKYNFQILYYKTKHIVPYISFCRKNIKYIILTAKQFKMQL